LALAAADLAKQLAICHSVCFAEHPKIYRWAYGVALLLLELSTIETNVANAHNHHCPTALSAKVENFAPLGAFSSQTLFRYRTAYIVRGAMLLLLCFSLAETKSQSYPCARMLTVLFDFLYKEGKIRRGLNLANV